MPPEAQTRRFTDFFVARGGGFFSLRAAEEHLRRAKKRTRAQFRATRAWFCLQGVSPVYSKPTNSRMGKGVGSLKGRRILVGPGRVVWGFWGLRPGVARRLWAAMSVRSGFRLEHVSTGWDQAWRASTTWTDREWRWRRKRRYLIRRVARALRPRGAAARSKARKSSPREKFFRGALLGTRISRLVGSSTPLAARGLWAAYAGAGLAAGPTGPAASTDIAMCMVL